MIDKYIRLAAFISLFIIFSILESFFPKRKRNCKRTTRWPANLIIASSSTFIGILLPFIVPFLAAEKAISSKIGLFNRYEIPLLLSFTLSFIFLDLIIYFQHRLFHTVEFFKIFHRMHHTDIDLDTSSALRFHPFEIMISMIIKTLTIFILGIHPAAVIAFETVLNSFSMFNHANIAIPVSADRIIRKIIVTPDMHRIHHSIIKTETNSNYGFFLSCWDYIFKSYKDQPVKGHTEMELGVSRFRNRKYLKLGWMLKTPFLK